ncbi:MAG: hypothetical protein AABX16_03320 [Nanoarchaeota archaeon]
MAEISIKVEIPEVFKKEFERALSKTLKEFSNKLELTLAKEIISESQFTQKDADELSEKVKKSMHDDLVKRGLL